MKRIKFAVIGCGNIGARHLAVIDAEPNADLVAICDIDASKCEKYKNLYPDIKVFSDYINMIKSVNADVIDICTPHHLHAPMAIASAQSGKDILVEKPISVTSTDAQEMIKAADANNVQLMVVKQNRYNVPVRLAQDAIESGKLGRIFFVQCNVLWNRYNDYYSLSSWRGKKEFEGGVLYTQVSHFIDLLILWFGEIKSADTRLAIKNHDNIDIEDSGHSVFSFNSGIMGTLNWSTCVYNKNYEGSITIIGENGSIKIGGLYLNSIDYWDVRAYPIPSTIDFSDKPNIYSNYQGTSSNHDKVIKDVILKLSSKDNTVVDGREAIKTVQAIELLYKNARYI